MQLNQHPQTLVAKPLPTQGNWPKISLTTISQLTTSESQRHKRAITTNRESPIRRRLSRTSTPNETVLPEGFLLQALSRHDSPYNCPPKALTDLAYPTPKPHAAQASRAETATSAATRSVKYTRGLVADASRRGQLSRCKAYPRSGECGECKHQTATR